MSIHHFPPVFLTIANSLQSVGVFCLMINNFLIHRKSYLNSNESDIMEVPISKCDRVTSSFSIREIYYFWPTIFILKNKIVLQHHLAVCVYILT
jgi:hypothetical protein